jgi:ring-1,2-phenylacetyl-CoA epoxidase subunit PaaE
VSRRSFHRLTITAVDRLCEDAAAVTFDVPAELSGIMSFRAGEHVNLRRQVDGVEERRTYSVCSPVGGPLRIGVRRVPGGAFSPWLVDEARPGDQVDVQPPEGRFTVDAAAGGRHVLVGAGSGITPLLSMAGSLLAGSPDARVTLVYGNRRVDTAMFLEEVADLKDAFPARFDPIHVLSREPRDVALFSGRLDGARLRGILDALVPVGAVDGFWLCGPMAMVDQHRKVLRTLGVPPERVHTELFFADAPPPVLVHPDDAPAGPVHSVSFTLDGRASLGRAARGVTVLEAAQEVRPDVPFACRGGVCGTCRARVVSGEVTMRRNYALEDHEVASGFVLTCQAEPTTDSVTVDFDA